MRNTPFCSAFTIILFTSNNICVAQTGKQFITTLKPPPTHIVIDGYITEWGDSLRYYNAEKKINYSIANTSDTLYLAVRINDRPEQIRILRAGLTFSVDPKGKKKETYSIIFPLSINGKTTQMPWPKDGAMEMEPEDRDALKREELTTLRGIKVTGFKDIEGDMITNTNTYGIQTAVTFDEKEGLVCEAAIPMQFFQDNEPLKNEWAFNIRINGLSKRPPDDGSDPEGHAPGGRSGRDARGRGYGGGGGAAGFGRGHVGRRGGNRTGAADDEGRGILFKSEDFWGKFYLAN